MHRTFLAEFFGTFFLVFIGCASIVLMIDQIGVVGVAFAFGLTLTALIYAFGPISGGHFNPAVSMAALLAGRINVRSFVRYVIAQCLGAVLAASLLYFVAQSQPYGHDIRLYGFGQTEWVTFTTVSVFLMEVILTLMFTMIILGSTHKKAHASFAGLVIGLTLVAIHLAGVSVSGASVNPARSLGPALFAGPEALSQLWLYIVAPLVGGALAGLVYRFCYGRALSSS